MKINAIRGWMFHLGHLYLTLAVNNYKFVLFEIGLLDVDSISQLEFCIFYLTLFNINFNFGLNMLNENFIHTIYK